MDTYMLTQISQTRHSTLASNLLDSIDNSHTHRQGSYTSFWNAEELKLLTRRHFKHWMIYQLAVNCASVYETRRGAFVSQSDREAFVSLTKNTWISSISMDDQFPMGSMLLLVFRLLDSSRKCRLNQFGHLSWYVGHPSTQGYLTVSESMRGHNFVKY